MSQERTRERERHAWKDEVHAGFTCTHTHTRRRGAVYHEDHTFACTSGSLSAEGATVLPLGVCTREKIQNILDNYLLLLLFSYLMEYLGGRQHIKSIISPPHL